MTPKERAEDVLIRLQRNSVEARQLGIIRKAIEAAGARWQPIETAPKDGSLILLYPTNGDGRISTGAWWQPENGHACWAAGHGWFEVGEVSHWMPIPPPPNRKGIDR